MSGQPLRIFLVDDHEVVRAGLRALLEKREGLTIVGEAAGVAEAVDKALASRPDVVLMDVRLEDGSGIEACRKIMDAGLGIRVLMLTSFSDDEAVISSILAGASGYLLKQIDAESVYQAIDAVSRGELLLDPDLTRTVLERIRAASEKPPEKGMDALTKRELEVLELIARGMTNKEIATELYLSDKTVRNYVSSILDKLDISHRTQAAIYFIENKHLQE